MYEYQRKNKSLSYHPYQDGGTAMLSHQ